MIGDSAIVLERVLERIKISQGKSKLTIPFYNSTGNIVDDWKKM